eukprot:5212032-Amphidinium_carterae.1
MLHCDPVAAQSNYSPHLSMGDTRMRAASKYSLELSRMPARACIHCNCQASATQECEMRASIHCNYQAVRHKDALEHEYTSIVKLCDTRMR